MASKRRRQTKRLRFRGIDPVAHNASVAEVKKRRSAWKRYRAGMVGIGGLQRAMQIFARSINQAAKSIREFDAAIRFSSS